LARAAVTLEMEGAKWPNPWCLWWWWWWWNSFFDNFFPKSCCLWDNVEKYGRVGQATDDSITWRMRLACWIPKATNTDSQHVTINVSTSTMAAWTRLSVTLYVLSLSCFDFRWE
jgi:hypothetical protein